MLQVGLEDSVRQTAERSRPRRAGRWQVTAASTDLVRPSDPAEIRRAAFAAAVTVAVLRTSGPLIENLLTASILTTNPKSETYCVGASNSTLARALGRTPRGFGSISVASGPFGGTATGWLTL